MFLFNLFRDKNKENAEKKNKEAICVCGNKMVEIKMQYKHGKMWINDTTERIKYYCNKCGGITKGAYYLEGFNAWIDFEVAIWVDEVDWIDKNTRFIDNNGKVVFKGK